MKIFYQWIFLWLGLCLYAQPSGTCTEGTTQLGSDGHLYGCVVDTWKKLSNNTATPTTFSTTEGSTGMVANKVILRTGGSNYELPARGFTPITGVRDAPTHSVGKVFYSRVNKHFYQGVANNSWHQLDPYMVYRCTRHAHWNVVKKENYRVVYDKTFNQTIYGCENRVNGPWTEYYETIPRNYLASSHKYVCNYYNRGDGFVEVYDGTFEITHVFSNCTLVEHP